MSRIVACLTLPLVFAAALAAEERPVRAKIVGADLFKNGVAVVRSRVDLSGEGTYLLDKAPEPIHGTFRIDAPGCEIEASVVTRDVEVPATTVAPGNFQEDLANKKVTVHFRSDKRTPLSGTVIKCKPEKVTASGNENPTFVGEYLTPTTAPNRYLLLKTGKGVSYIETADIAAVETEEPVETVTRKRPRMLLHVRKLKEGMSTVSLTYLTHGLTWMPNYRIDVADPAKLVIEQTAVLKNELTDLEGVELRLISGFPSMKYSHVRSPLSPRSSIASFLAESSVSQQQQQYGQVALQGIVDNSRRDMLGLVSGAKLRGEGVDLFYQAIGKRTLAEGESLATSIARESAEYKRIVEWTINDTRNEQGYANRQNSGSDDEDQVESPWDALRFKNPFSFPLTTAPATVTTGDIFNGQQSIHWTDSGEETVVCVNKALSISSKSIEHESAAPENERQHLWHGGSRYRKVTVEAEAVVSNHRKEAISMVIRRRFSGELKSAEGDPRSTLREEGVYSVNRRHQLVWNLDLKPGEEKHLKYSYTVLVRE